MSYPPTPPLLLTQRLSSFLHSSLLTLQQQQQQSAPVLHTALLITPSGKLLAYESQTPMRTLRTQCSVAASLWAIHASSSSSVGTALGQQQQQQQQPQSPPLTAATSPSSLHQQHFPQLHAQHQHLGDADIDQQQFQQQQRNDDGSVPTSIAASFNGGAVFVVRRLRCGLLFACATAPLSRKSRPSTVNDASPVSPGIDISGLGISDPDIPATATPSSLLPQSIPLATAAEAEARTTSATSPLQHSRPPSLPTPIIHPPASAETGLVAAASVKTSGTAESYTTAEAGNGGGSHDRDGGDRDGGDHDAASMTTTATTTTAGDGARQRSSVAVTVVIARRQVEQLALLLDEKLGTLSVPEENIGANGFR